LENKVLLENTIQDVTQKKKTWKEAVRKYQKSDTGRSVWQLINSVVPYFIMWYLMIRSLEISYWLTLALAIPAAGFLVRIFIIFHDCGHGAFLKNRKVSEVVGFITGMLVFTPHHQWWHRHAVHHATAGDLDRRGVGDVWTMTIDEYMEASPSQQRIYRIYRNPIAMFLIGPVFVFLFLNRFVPKDTKSRERSSILMVDLTILGILILAYFTIGIKAYLLIQVPIMWIAASTGVWLFYVQHQFEDVYWERHENWDYTSAALDGSSFYKLPKLLQWFSGNIGFHHIHHLSPRIPNYYLEQCHEENPIFQVKPVTLQSSLKSLSFRLWDEQNNQLVGYEALKGSQPVA
jgi:omega-6 fatty acid desaturase (delta-12 desaturase)